MFEEQLVDQLQQRIQELEAECRRWRIGSLIGLILLLLLFLGGGLFVAGIGGFMGSKRVRQLEHQRLMLEEELRIERLKQARQEAEKAPAIREAKDQEE